MHPRLNSLEEHTAIARYAVCRTASCVYERQPTNETDAPCPAKRGKAQVALEEASIQQSSVRERLVISFRAHHR